MKCVSRNLVLTVLIIHTFQPSIIAAPKSLPLLSSLRAEDVGKILCQNASLFHYPSRGTLTFTFRHTAGEPEVRLPVALLGWPTDWSDFKAVQSVFHSSSLETISLGFFDGRQTKLFRIEPLAGIRIKAVIPFDAFLPTPSKSPTQAARLQDFSGGTHFHVQKRAGDYPENAVSKPTHSVHAPRFYAHGRGSGR